MKPQYIINFAAQGMVAESWLNPNHWYKTNLLSQVSLHDEIRKCKFLKNMFTYLHPRYMEILKNGFKRIIISTQQHLLSKSCSLVMHLMSFYQSL